MGCVTVIGAVLGVILGIWFISFLESLNLVQWLVILMLFGLGAIALYVLLKPSSGTSVSNTASEPVSAGDYKIIVKNGRVTIVRFISVDSGTIEIPSMINNMPVRVIGTGAFKDCKQMEKVMIPGSVIEIQDNAFQNCSGLREVVMPSTVKKLGKAVFSDCRNLSNINLPDSITNIPEKCFYYCKELHALSFPASVKWIDGQAFAESGLRNVSLPEGIQKIGSEAFGYCRSLRSILIPKELKDIADDAFRSTWSFTIYCYGNSYGLEYARKHNINYKNAEEWS